MRLISFLLLFCISLYAKPLEKKKNILVLHSFHQNLPWTKDLSEGLKQANIKYDMNIEFYQEYLDYLRLDKSLSSKQLKDLIKVKYKNIKFDAVIIDSLYAYNLYKKVNLKSLSSLPHIFAVTKNVPLYLKNSINIIKNNHKNITGTIKLIKKLHPNSRKILFIESNRGEFSIIKKELLLQKGIKVEFFNDFSQKELYKKIYTLPKEYIILHSLVFRDNTNYKLIPLEVLNHITQITKNPIYVPYSPLFVEKVVGGHVLSATTIGKSLVEAFYDFDEHKTFKSDYKVLETLINYNLMKQHKINESFLPKEANIKNKPKSIIDEFLYEVIVVGIFIVFLFLLLALLIKQTLKTKTLNKRLKKETEEKIKKQEMLNKQLKNALMGEMINSIAHQWRQPLARINSNLAIIDIHILNKDPKELIDQKISNIEEQTSYMSRTIDDFANFFSQNKEKINFNVSQTLKSSINLLSSRLKNIEVNYLLDEKVELNSYKNEFSQVVLAIVNNAIDNFEINQIKDAKLEIILKEDKLKNKIVIEIRDNAGGIEEKIKEKIFDAYFSTKEGIKSSGLGLYISKNIINNSMNGNIYAKNHKDGACFKIIFKKEESNE